MLQGKFSISITKRLVLCSLLIEYYSGDSVKKNEMGAAHNTCEGEKRCLQDFGGES